MGRKDPDSDRKYKAEYYQKNKVKILAKQKKRYKENIDEIRIREKAYRERTKEQRREYLRNNQDKANERARARRDVLQRWYESHLECIVCNDCDFEWGSRHGLAEFHHEDRTNKKSMKIALYTGYNAFIDQCEKGVFLCPTCHVIRHLAPDGRRMNKNE